MAQGGAMNQTAAIDPRYCYHCFCKQDTGGSWYCCKCGIRLDDLRVIPNPIMPTDATIVPIRIHWENC